MAGRRDDVFRDLAERGLHPPDSEREPLRGRAAQEQARDVLALLGGPPPDGACPEQIDISW